MLYRREISEAWRGVCFVRISRITDARPTALATLTLTDEAIRALKQMLAESSSGAMGMRIIISSACLNRLQFGLRLEPRPRPDDEVLEYDTFRIFLDPDSAPLIEETTIDFVDGRETSGFRFTCPRHRNS